MLELMELKRIGLFIQFDAIREAFENSSPGSKLKMFMADYINGCSCWIEENARDCVALESEEGFQRIMDEFDGMEGIMNVLEEWISQEERGTHEEQAFMCCGTMSRHRRPIWPEERDYDISDLDSSVRLESAN